ncbi:copper resistance CopC/CopD family protein [Bacillus fonticola]|uniref:copper resistance CopC/CopD family protein n=1 Tax=Bacillus fonticola TaxID=2728853 RepID=UPI001473D65F|nr:copper resistance protein CopC [Bacillus fonticola]
MNGIYQFIKVTVGLLFLFLFIPNSALAHSSIEKTSPEDGEKLEQSPGTIDIWFGDPVVTYSDSIKLYGSNGEEYNIGKTINDPNSKLHITADIPEKLPKGRYTVEIKVMALDGYVIKDEIAYEISSPEMSEESTGLKLIKQTPSDGEIITGQPKQIDLWFNQPAQLTAIGLFDDKQGNVLLQQPVVDPQNPNHLTVAIDQPIKDGTYQVTWYARPAENADVSTPDIIDVFYFAVNEFTPITEVQNGPAVKKSWFPDIGVKQLGYWLWLTGASILFGGSVIAYTSRKDEALFRRWKIYSAFFLFTSLVGISIILYELKVELNDLNLTDFISLKFVWVPIIQVAVFFVGYLYKKGQPWLYGAGLSLIPFITGHSSYPRYGGWPTLLVNEMHIFAAALWLGGILAIIIIPRKDQLFEYIQRNGSKFSRIAFWSIVVLAFTGVYMTFQYVPSFSFKSFVDSQWGKALLVKTLLTFVILMIGFMQRKYIKRMVSSFVGKFQGRLKVEFVYGLFVLLFASILVVGSPSTAEQGVYLESTSNEDAKLDVTFSPQFIGVNELTLSFKDEIESVNVVLSMPPSYEVAYDAFKVNKNTFKLTGNLLHAAGTVIMQVEAKTSSGNLLNYQYKVVVPGEYRLNE